MRGIAKGRALAVMFIMLGALLAGTSLLPSTQAAVLYVGGAGPGNYTTIQEAIDASAPGDAVYVYGGWYPENVLIDKSIDLVGQNQANTTIDGQDIGNVVTIRASSVTISGFTIRDGNPDSLPGSGIEADQAHGLLVQDNSLLSSRCGIHTFRSNNVTILSNTFDGNPGCDVYVEQSSGYTISNNEFRGFRVYIEYSSSVEISENRFAEGVHLDLYSGESHRIANNTLSGVYFFHIARTAVEGNTISGGGISMHFGYLNVIHRNRITDSYTGIVLYGSWYSTISENDIIGNGHAIILPLNEFEIEAQSRHNVIYHNNFIDNRFGVCDSGNGTRWDDGYPSGGNYWSDYTGPDESSGPNQTEPGNDGIGDEPRVVYVCPYFPYEYVQWEHHEDRYPLMDPFLPSPAPPSAPIGLNATGVGHGVRLEWKPPPFDGGSPIANYTIYRGTAPGAETFLVEVGNDTSYMDHGLELGRTDYYRVSAKNAVGEGPKSNEASATVPVALKPPLDLIRVPGFENNTVNWTPPGGGGGSRICGSSGHEDFEREAGNVSSRRLGTSPDGGVR